MTFNVNNAQGARVFLLNWDPAGHEIKGADQNLTTAVSTLLKSHEPNDVVLIREISAKLDPNSPLTLEINELAKSKGVSLHLGPSQEQLKDNNFVRDFIDNFNMDDYPSLKDRLFILRNLFKHCTRRLIYEILRNLEKFKIQEADREMRFAIMEVAQKLFPKSPFPIDKIFTAIDVLKFSTEEERSQFLELLLKTFPGGAKFIAQNFASFEIGKNDVKVRIAWLEKIVNKDYLSGFIFIKCFNISELILDERIELAKNLVKISNGKGAPLLINYFDGFGFQQAPLEVRREILDFCINTSPFVEINTITRVLTNVRLNELSLPDSYHYLEIINNKLKDDYYVFRTDCALRNCWTGLGFAHHLTTLDHSDARIAYARELMQHGGALAAVLPEHFTEFNFNTLLPNELYSLCCSIADKGEASACSLAENIDAFLNAGNFSLGQRLLLCRRIAVQGEHAAKVVTRTGNLQKFQLQEITKAERESLFRLFVNINEDATGSTFASLDKIATDKEEKAKFFAYLLISTYGLNPFYYRKSKSQSPLQLFILSGNNDFTEEEITEVAKFAKKPPFEGMWEEIQRYQEDHPALFFKYCRWILYTDFLLKQEVEAKS